MDREFVWLATPTKNRRRRGQLLPRYNSLLQQLPDGVGLSQVFPGSFQHFTIVGDKAFMDLTLPHTNIKKRVQIHVICYLFREEQTRWFEDFTKLVPKLFPRYCYRGQGNRKFRDLSVKDWIDKILNATSDETSAIFDVIQQVYAKHMVNGQITPKKLESIKPEVEKLQQEYLKTRHKASEDILQEFWQIYKKTYAPLREKEYRDIQQSEETILKESKREHFSYSHTYDYKYQIDRKTSLAFKNLFKAHDIAISKTRGAGWVFISNCPKGTFLASARHAKHENSPR